MRITPRLVESEKRVIQCIEVVSETSRAVEKNKEAAITSRQRKCILELLFYVVSKPFSPHAFQFVLVLRFLKSYTDFEINADLRGFREKHAAKSLFEVAEQREEAR